ncbi:MAG: four helix bundle protein [Phycisphaerae bacterium]
MLRTYRDLKVWQKAFRLCAHIYTATRGLPRDERFGLTAQMRRAAGISARPWKTSTRWSACYPHSSGH